jgi:exosome complex component RRP41
MQIADILGIAGLRIDGRRGNEIRKLKTKLNVENTADGSCYLEQGLNKALVLVHGPHEPSRRSSEQNEVVSL